VSYLGYKEDQFKDIDSFKEQYNKDFIKRSIAEKDDEIITKITGKFAGSTLTAIKRMAKAANITLEKDIIENKKIEDIIDHIGEHMGKSIDGVKTEYETKLKATETEAVKEWKEKFEKLNEKHKDTDNLVKTMKDQLKNSESEYKTKLKQYKIGDTYKSALSQIKFASTVDELKRKGFESLLSEKYELDVDETDAVFIKDKSSGGRIPNPAKNGEFLGVADVISFEAEKNNMIQKNNSHNSFTFGNANGDKQTFKTDTEVKDMRAVPASQRK
jgi:hypothetical protein